MSQSTKPRRSRKVKTDRPPKPYEDFPLCPHPAGYWCKSIRGKVRYFGRWGYRKDGKMHRIEGDGWEAALEEYQRTRDALYQGRVPRPKSDGLTIRDLCNRYLTSKQRLLDNRELSPRTFNDYRRITDRLVTFFGKDRPVDDLVADDFEALRADMAKTLGPVRLGGEIQQTKMVFKFGYDNGLLDKPMRYGQGFRRPRADVIRKHRNGNGPKMFSASEIRLMLDSAGPQLRAMILLGINAGMGNSDCANLPLSALDLERGWIDYPRPKTGIDRRVPLWPETVKALGEAIAKRPTPKDKDNEGLVFITKRGLTWSKATSDNPISKELRKVLDDLGIHRKGVGFYALRHGFQTIGDEARDPIATRFIMGHAPAANDMSAVYREDVSDDRLRAVTGHVRGWLFRMENLRGYAEGNGLLDLLAALDAERPREIPEVDGAIEECRRAKAESGDADVVTEAGQYLTLVLGADDN